MKKIKDFIVFLIAFAYLGSIAYMAFFKGNVQAQTICAGVFILIVIPVSFMKIRQRLKEASIYIERQNSLHEIFKNKEFCIQNNVKGNFLVKTSEHQAKLGYLYLYVSFGLFIFIGGLTTYMYYFDSSACLNNENCLPSKYVFPVFLILSVLVIYTFYQFKIRWHFDQIVLSKSPPSVVLNSQSREQFKEISSIEISEKKYNLKQKILAKLVSKGKLSLNNSYSLVFSLEGKSAITRFKTVDYKQIEELKYEIKKLLKLNK